MGFFGDRIAIHDVRGMEVGDTLFERTRLGEISVERTSKARWLVRLGVGGVSLARSAERAVLYVRNRRHAALTAEV